MTCFAPLCRRRRPPSWWAIYAGAMKRGVGSGPIGTSEGDYGRGEAVGMLGIRRTDSSASLVLGPARSAVQRQPLAVLERTRVGSQPKSPIQMRTAPQGPSAFGAGDGNRTHVVSLGS